MRTFFAAVLGVIAVGVMLIAYGLLSPRVAAAPGDIVTLDSRGVAYQTVRRRARPARVSGVRAGFCASGVRARVGASRVRVAGAGGSAANPDAAGNQ